MGIVSIQVDDKKAVIVEYEDGRKVKYLYNHVLSENPDAKNPGMQMELNIKEAVASGNQN